MSTAVPLLDSRLISHKSLFMLQNHANKGFPIVQRNRDVVEIWGSHGGENVDSGLLRCEAVVASGSEERMVSVFKTYKTTWRHNPGDHNRRLLGELNFKFEVCRASLRPRGLRRGSWPVGCWDRGFESCLRHVCLSLVFLCCDVLCR
jgi:hypothetical protein